MTGQPRTSTTPGLALAQTPDPWLQQRLSESLWTIWITYSSEENNRKLSIRTARNTSLAFISLQYEDKISASSQHDHQTQLVGLGNWGLGYEVRWGLEGMFGCRTKDHVISPSHEYLLWPCNIVSSVAELTLVNITCCFLCADDSHMEDIQANQTAVIQTEKKRLIPYGVQIFMAWTIRSPYNWLNFQLVRVAVFTSYYWYKNWGRVLIGKPDEHTCMNSITMNCVVWAQNSGLWV